MTFPKNIIQNWRTLVKRSMPRNYGMELEMIRDVSQAVALVQASPLYREWIKAGFAKQDCEDALRAIFPLLNSTKPKW